MSNAQEARGIVMESARDPPPQGPGKIKKTGVYFVEYEKTVPMFDAPPNAVVP